MKGKITVLVGISGSGKSTWAHKEWEKDPLNTIVVNRDKIRELLFGFNESNVKQYYNNPLISSLEKTVTRYEDTLIYEALELDKHVIVDATHLGVGYIERFKYWNVPTKVVNFHLPENEAIKNDRKRIRQVGDEVIKKQFQQMIALLSNPKYRELDFDTTTVKQNPKLPPCVIFDVDGTIAVRGDRSAYDWKRVGEDKIDKSTVEIMSNLTECNDPAIIICTGRDGIAEFETRRWLTKHGIQFDGLFIREQGDMRPDWVVKEEMWRKIAKHYHITGIFDDRLQVVRRARALGLKVYHCEHNNF